MVIAFQSTGGEGTEAKKEFDPIPANTIADVEVIDVTYKEISAEFRAKYDIKDTHEVSFHFKVIDGPFKNRHIWGTAKPYLNESDRCRLRIWVQELLGIDKLPADFALNPNPDTGVFDEFTGLHARVFVENYTRKRDGKVLDRVRDVLRSVNPITTDEEEPF
jgi:hypothetical protein